MHKFRCGFATLIGRPNVGKSTLLNQLLGTKISITSRKPQTTRQRILGIVTTADTQTIYVDTPGIHNKTPHALNTYMNKVALQALRDVDVIIFMTENTRWTEEDDAVLQKLKKANAPVIWLLNKTDQLHDKAALLPHIETIAQQFTFAKVIPLSARRLKDVQRLSLAVQEFLPASTDLLYPAGQVTDRADSFIAAEFVREALLNTLGDEVPHVLTTMVEKIERKPQIIVVHAVIYVARDSHKAIIIGKQGERLRAVGQEARLALEKYWQQKVFLKLWVKIKEGWIDNKSVMRKLGFQEVE